MRNVILMTAILLMGQVSADDPTIKDVEIKPVPADVTWETTIKAGLATATKNKKDVIVIAGASQDAALFKLVLGDEGFAIEGTKLFVLVHSADQVDFDEVCKATGFKQDPTLIIMDAQGRVYSILEGFFPAKPTDYLAAVKQFIGVREKRDQLLAAADQAKGLARATLLHAALMQLIEGGLFQNGSYYGYDALVKEIVEIDAKNEGQLKSKWSFYAMMFPVQAKFSAKDYDGAFALIGAYVDEFKTTDVDFAQKALFVKAQIYSQLKDVVGLITTLNQVKDLGPTTTLGKAAIESLAAIQVQLELQKQQKELQKQEPVPEPNK